MHLINSCTEDVCKHAVDVSITSHAYVQYSCYTIHYVTHVVYYMYIICNANIIIMQIHIFVVILLMLHRWWCFYDQCTLFNVEIPCRAFAIFIAPATANLFMLISHSCRWQLQVIACTISSAALSVILSQKHECICNFYST